MRSGCIPFYSAFLRVRHQFRLTLRYAQHNAWVTFLDVTEVTHSPDIKRFRLMDTHRFASSNVAKTWTPTDFAEWKCNIWTPIYWAAAPNLSVYISRINICGLRSGHPPIWRPSLNFRQDIQSLEGDCLLMEIEIRRRESGSKSIRLRTREVHHDVNVMRGPRLTLKARSNRTSDHIFYLQLI